MKKPRRVAVRSEERPGRSRLASAAKPVPKHWAAIEAFLDRHAIWLATGLVLLATIRIAFTYTSLSHVFDEPAHIACGMEWLQKHTYTYEAQHPPLTRVMTALLPSVFGAHTWNKQSMWDEGLAILFANGAEDRTLALARAGTLPFFWIACCVLFLCGRWIYNGAAAVVAVFLVSMTPTVLAHAGLATTDMGLTAMLLLAVYTGWRWIEEPVWWRAAAFGISTGLAILAKFSTLAFLPSIALVALVIWWIFERPRLGMIVGLARARGAQLAAAAVIACVVIWAGYRFSFGKSSILPVPVPAPELFNGVQEVWKHNATGHLTYLLGKVNTVGWPYFYIVALGVKTPLLILALGFAGLLLLFSRKLFGTRGWIVPSIVLGILIFASFFTRIVIGTRHVLPAIVALGIAGGCAAVWLLRRLEGRTLWQSAVGLIVLSVAAISGSAHPDYLAYFNILAGDKPEAFLVDSDLDWGQDTKKLAKRLNELGATEVYFNQFAPGNLEKLYRFPPIHPLDINGPRPGWNAVSITPLKLGLFGNTRYVYDPGARPWPEEIEPTERIGRGILLFYNGSIAR